MSLHWNVDSYSIHFDRIHLRGWAHNLPDPIAKVEAVFPEPIGTIVFSSFGKVSSVDLVAMLGASASACRFDEWVTVPRELANSDFSLTFTLANGVVISTGLVHQVAEFHDPFHACWRRFLEMLYAMPPGVVLEIGSRARSGITRKEVVGHHDYVGMDILPGPNVDLVGDAHELSQIFAGRKFVAAFSFSVFEHLVMPWKVALELNSVLGDGGLIFTQTHQTWPMHEEPWDFWRFSQHSWRALFNSSTGYEIIETAAGDYAEIYPCRPTRITRDLPQQSAYLGSACIAKKQSDSVLSWPVPTQVAARDMYPKGESAQPR
jgi:hypothetical protein